MLNTTSNGTTSKNKPLHDINANNHSASNNLIGIALQSLYKRLREENLMDSVTLFEDAEPPQTIKEENKLLLQKVQALENSI